MLNDQLLLYLLDSGVMWFFFVIFKESRFFNDYLCSNGNPCLLKKTFSEHKYPTKLFPTWRDQYIMKINTNKTDTIQRKFFLILKIVTNDNIE